MEQENSKLHETESSEPVNVLLAAIFNDNEKDCLSSLDELELLAATSIGDTADSSSFYKLTQCRTSPDPAMYIGTGKAQEAGQLCAEHNVTLAVVDGELSPSQIRNLEDEINKYTDDKTSVRVIDRTMLILDIFAKHAVTNEGKLQVEIAQLKYTAPRLTGKGLQLSRQGGTSGSIGARGPGETKLETDKRHIQRRILSLRASLAAMEGERSVKRSKRIKGKIPMAVIAGYTNAGKSTLLNYLTDAGILAEDKLFATLDPTVRKLVLPSGREMLLSDTVGFINRLPHQLVEAFKSTLDEVKYADIILVMIDSSDEQAKLKTQVTEDILLQLDAAGKPTVYVYNKCDRLDILPPKEVLDATGGVCISAKDGTGVDTLLEKLDEILAESKKLVRFLFPFDVQSIVNTLYKNASVQSVDYTDDGVAVEALVDEKLIGQYKKYIID